MNAALPSNIEAEAVLLGAMMMSASAIDPVADRLTPDDFFEPIHARIFSAIIGQHSQGKVANPVTLKPFFENDEAMREVGGPSYLGQLTGSGASLVGVKGMAEQVWELAARRRMIVGLQDALVAAHDCEEPLAGVGDRIDGAAAAGRDEQGESGEYSAAAALDLVLDGFDKPVTGALCGVIPSIDDLLGPMRPTQLVIGAGRPGMGKTATAISYALGAAERGHGVLFVSLEMGAEQLAERMAGDLCLEHRIPYESIRDRRLTQEQRREVARARVRVESLPLQILDRHGLTIKQLRRLVRRWVRRFAARGQKLEVVIVDYLQLLRADARMDRFEAVTEISKSLKEMAKEQGLAVFALSQLSREVEKRADKRPQLSDLRESGQIEQDADAVLFFLRHQYYLEQAGEPPPNDPKHHEWESALERCRGRIEFICAKRRNGLSGSRVGEFLGTFQAVRG